MRGKYTLNEKTENRLEIQSKNIYVQLRLDMLGYYMFEIQPLT